jgi:hypothetical protein
MQQRRTMLGRNPEIGFFARAGGRVFWGAYARVVGSGVSGLGQCQGARFQG